MPVAIVKSTPSKVTVVGSANTGVAVPGVATRVRNKNMSSVLRIRVQFDAGCSATMPLVLKPMPKA